MIVDDSIVARTAITRLLDVQEDFEVVATASSATQALSILDSQPVDIILLDLNMPGVDGLTALPEMIRASGGAHVLIVSSSCGDGAAATVEALTLGATDTLLKPQAGQLARGFGETLIERLTRIACTPRGMPPRTARAPADLRDVASASQPIACLAIGASTGGPHALAEFFRALPASFDAPILVTQHLPPTFMSYFASQLETIARRSCRIATEGAVLECGAILIAPGDAHLSVARKGDSAVVRLEHHAVASGCLPSVDVMLAGVARVFGRHGAGVILSGIGRDGIVGAAEMIRRGGDLFVQDAESSVVWGMPGAASGAGLATAILPPARIAHRVGRRSGAMSWR